MEKLLPQQFNQSFLTKLFFSFLILHAFLWTVVPTFIRYTIPMDALEGFVWGQHLQFGYDRNPWLNAWLTEFAVKFGGTSGWLVYLFSQLCVILCFWSVWQLGKEILNPLYALVSVFLLIGVQYYNVAAVDFNDNVLEVGLWAAIALCFYSAVKEQKLHYWMLTGFFAALAAMAKYYVIILLMPMFVFLLVTRKGRRSFFNIGIYCSLLIFLILVMPHYIWLQHNDFSTLRYAVMRINDHNVSADPNATPIFFFAKQLRTFIPAFALFLFLIPWKNSKSMFVSRGIMLNNYDKYFLIIIGLCPFVLNVIAAFVGNKTMHVMWGAPLPFLWGIFLLAFFQPRITLKRFNIFIFIVLFTFFAILGGYSYMLLFHADHSSANYPGKEISQYVMQKWYAKFHVKPSYIIGTRYTAGNIAYFSVDKPLVCVHDKVVKCQPDMQALNRYGAIFVWTVKQDISELEVLKTANLFKSTMTEIKNFYWKREKVYDEPIKIGYAFLPPANAV